jgi:hypothetical protein
VRNLIYFRSVRHRSIKNDKARSSILHYSAYALFCSAYEISLGSDPYNDFPS